MATYNDIKKIKIGNNTFVFHVPTASEVGALPSSTTIPAITLNGAANTSPSFYAPTTAGTNGYVLKSNGSGAPTWTSATLTDTKVTTAGASNNTTYYIMLADGVNTKTRQIDSLGNGLKYNSTYGTTSTIGTAILHLGNFIPSGTDYNSKGILRLYGTNANWTDLISGAPTAARTITLPDATGTLALNTVVTAGSSISSGGLMSQADKTRLDGLPDIVELTQAEYNALSTSEKNNGTIYYVTDRPVGGLNNLRDGAAAGSLEMTTTSALKSYQVALGTYNLEDTGDDKDLSNFAFIIGNGVSDNARSNLFTVNKSGLVTTHITPTEDYEWNTMYPPNPQVGTQYFTGFEIRDAAGNRTTHMDIHSNEDGSVSGVLGVEKIISGEVVRNQLFLKVEVDGSKTYWLDNPDEFAKAINLGYSVADCTRASGWTDYASGYGPVVYKRGGVCTFHWEAKPTASSVTIGGTPVTICTVPSGYRPIRTTYAICQGSGTSIYVLQINSNGAVTVQRLRENANANNVYTNGGSGSYSWFPMYMTYVCAPQDNN